MHGLDDIRDLILYVESIIESFSADLKPGIAGAQAGGGRSGWDAAPSAHHA